MIKRVLTLVAAMHVTASVFINDDERGMHTDYEKWLEGSAPHAPISQYQHNLTGKDNADSHLKRAAQIGCTLAAETGSTSQVMGRAAVVAVTNGRLDGFALLTRTLGTWERIFRGQAEGLARES